MSSQPPNHGIQLFVVRNTKKIEKYNKKLLYDGEICLCNLNSLINKVNMVARLLFTFSISILVITETWLLPIVFLIHFLQSRDTIQ